MLSRFHLILERYGQTDRFAISISRVSVLMHDKSQNYETEDLQITVTLAKYHTDKVEEFTHLGKCGKYHTRH